MIDSGSSGTFMSKSAAKKLKLYVIPKNDEVPLADSNQTGKIIGEVVIDLEVNGCVYKSVVVEVLKDLFIDLLIGRDFLRRHKRVVLQFGGPEEDLVLGAVSTNKTSHKSMDLKSEFFPRMKVDPPPLFTNLSKNCKPIATKSRRYSPADMKFIKEEVDKLSSLGIIRPSVSPWRAQPLVTKDERHKRRMVIDYSQTINLFTELDAYPMPDILKMVQELSNYKYFSTFDLKSAYYQVPIREEDCKFTAFEVNGELWEFTCVPFGITNGVSGFQRTIDKVIKSEQLDKTFAYLDNVTVCGNTLKELEHNVSKFHQVREKYNITLNDEKTISSVASVEVIGYTVSHNKITPDYSRLTPLLEMPPPINLKSQKRVIGMFSYYSKFIPKFSDKILNLNRNTTFPLPAEALHAFQTLKNDLKDAALHTIDYNEPFVVETDASDFCIAASLNQNGRPVAFFSRTLNSHEIKHHPVEKEAAAIVEAVGSWRHFLLGREFTLITDQKSVGFMYDNRRRTKIKNDKIGRWRVELSEYKYNIKYRPGKDNVVADTFSRIAAVTHPLQELRDLHEKLCHPGITRLSHYVRVKNLPFSQEDVKKVTSTCKSCCFLKPKFLHSQGSSLIKAIAPFQRLNIDFKGPLPASSSGNRYLLTIIDEYSRFPFAYACRDTSSKTVTHCLNQLFAIFGMSDMMHNDRAPDFLSEEVKQFLTKKGVATSKTSRYNPKCNGQVEKLNGTLWKAIQVTLHSRKLKSSNWEDVLPDALHSIRSLLCTTTNTTPHERLFNYERRSSTGKSIPSWVKPGPVYVRNHIRNSKNDPPVSQATLVHANPEYAHIRLPSGFETTVSIRDLAQFPEQSTIDDVPQGDPILVESALAADPRSDPHQTTETSVEAATADEGDKDSSAPTSSTQDGTDDSAAAADEGRRLTRQIKLPVHFGDFEVGYKPTKR